MPANPNDYHEPVMVAEALQYLDLQPGDWALDATLGGGGHSASIAQALGTQGVLVGLDRDPEAIAAASERLESFRATLTIILLPTPFSKLDFVLETHEETAGRKFDGILFDLGVSSHQLDAVRGFSFRRDEPLDMRMDTTAGDSAAELLARISERELAQILWEFGEERWSRKIARDIIAYRQKHGALTTTGELAKIIEASVPKAAHPRDIHVATRSFQAIRIAVNEELTQLQEGLKAALTRLKPGGRIVVLSYHSLEDRIVKQALALAAGRSPAVSGNSPEIFLEAPTAPATLELLTKKPVLPTDAEIARNSRARSAKLRAARKRE